MYFFEVKAHQQHQVLLKVMPDVEPIIDFVGHIMGQLTSDEAEAVRALQVKLRQADALVLAEPDNAEYKSAVARAEADVLEAQRVLKKRNKDVGYAWVMPAINDLLTSKFELVVRVLSAFYNMEPEEFGAKYDIFEMVDAGRALITNEKILRFFPQLRRLVSTTPSGILPNVEASQ